MRQKIIPVLIVLAGFLLLSYPFMSNYLFERSAGSMVRSYGKKTAGMNQEMKEKALDEARRYNEELLSSSIQLTDPFKAKKTDGETLFYNNILSLEGSGIMGYVKIPCISVDLPIYHGTSTEVLERGIGHLAASSFPIGGKSTHAVLTGHTGLSSAKLFTDLTEMNVIRPENTRKLQIIDGKDYVTLLTCTPYGVNDHRLLVRGIRTEYHEKEELTKERPHYSQWMEVYRRAILIGLLIVFALIISRKVYVKIKGRRKR